MINIHNLTIYGDMIFELEYEEFDLLKKTGKIYIEDKKIPENLENDTLCIASEDFCFDESEEFINFFNSALFVKFFKENEKGYLLKFSDLPLKEIVDKEYEKMKKENTLSKANLINLKKDKKNFNWIEENLLDMVRVCSCGIEGCGCDFAYIRDYLLLVDCGCGGCRIYYINFFPENKDQ